MNEARFVDMLQRRFPFRRGLGIGDDSSVVPYRREFQLITTDLLVENVHFRLADFTMAELAKKSLAVNLSDIAAMGGAPEYVYLGLAFPDRLPESQLFEFFQGLESGCRKWDVDLAGGDYSSSALMTISVTVVGVCRKPALRKGALVGDLIGVTGTLGESALGLRQINEGKKSSRFILRHKRPEPQINEGLTLAPYVNAMIDVSDGLLLDLQRLLDASGLGAEIDTERLPVSDSMKNYCLSRGWDPWEFVFGGGEDYVLLFTVSEENERMLRRRGINYRLIGRIQAKTRLTILKQGEPIEPECMGFDHFMKKEDAAREDQQKLPV